MSEPKILISGGSYQSPIHQIVGDISTQIIQDGENQIFQAIQKSNIVVEKDELIKALQYDRNQYDKGYSDGRASIDINSIDRTVKVNIYLLRRYREDLLKEFGLNEDNAFNLCDCIADKMNEEMPKLWYEYGFVKGYKE